jgi:NAD(P)-dependent dehydrogenase (short-subunit alcohol dehydrogenase family)
MPRGRGSSSSCSSLSTEQVLVAGAPTGKTVLVTGGSGGIGRAAATGLASMGARVGITGRDKATARGRFGVIVSGVRLHRNISSRGEGRFHW